MKKSIETLLILPDGNLNKNSSRILKNPKNSEVLSFIDKTEDAFVFKSRSLSEKLFRVLYDIQEPPKCKICQKNYLPFSVFKLGYVVQYCSPQCQMKDPICIEKRLITTKKLNKPNKNIGKTRTDKQKANIKNALAKVDKEKAKSKKQETCKIKYGAENVFQSAHFYIKKYEARLLKLRKKLKDFDFEIIDFFDNGRINLIKHNKCGESFKLPRLSPNSVPTCPLCYKNPKTRLQTELVEFIKSIFDDDIIIDSKKIISPYQLDIFIPSKNIAFEFNGLYWHSSKKAIDPNYHYNKSFLCNEQNIQLFHIFEDDWLLKNEICKNRIRHLLQKNEKIFARKCTVREIKTAKQFLEDNHIQGFTPAKVSLGLFYNEKLIATMTFGKPRYDKRFEWELLRYCSKETVVGGAGKLLKYFKKQFNPTSIITYRDKAWGFKSNFYNDIGFSFLRSSKIGYSYYKEGQFPRISRIAFQSKNFYKTNNTHYDAALSEEINAALVKAYRVYDCGNDVYGWKL
ncbi:MAG: hypothetical protein QXN55_01080 [Candidatus Nitrosotenuis sp.]